VEFLSFTKFSNASVFTDSLGAAPNNHTKIGPKDENRQRVIHSLNNNEGSFRAYCVPEQNIQDDKFVVELQWKMSFISHIKKNTNKMEHFKSSEHCSPVSKPDIY